LLTTGTIGIVYGMNGIIRGMFEIDA